MSIFVRHRCRLTPFSRFFGTGRFTLPDFERKPFAKLTADDIRYFKSSLSSGSVIDDSDVLSGQNVDFMNIYKGNSTLLLKPKTVEDLSTILKYCNDKELAVCPQGGNTGLVGGSVPVFDEIIVSTSRMNKILDFDEASGIVTVEAGVVLQDLMSFLDGHGYIVPYDLGAKGSCHVGGNVATNAGGIRLCRYGPIAGSLLGVEAVLPGGSVFGGLSRLKKDNTGLRTAGLFLGSEGTLGVISKVALACPHKPKSVNVALMQCPTFEAVVKAARMLRGELSDIVSAVEFFDHKSLGAVLSRLPHARDQFAQPSPFYLLVETHGQSEEFDSQRLSNALEKILEDKQGLVTDAVLADTPSHQSAIWTLRESIAGAMVDLGKCLKYDVTLPVGKMYSPVQEIENLMTANGIRVPEDGYAVGYGHLGDANIHINVLSLDPAKDSLLQSVVEGFIYKHVVKLEGSISAEHGVGLQKARKLALQRDEGQIELMKQIKGVFDPKGIMNPYKCYTP